MFPPEINSGLMYSGAGSGTLNSAAAAWHALAENLTTTGSSVSSVASGLQGPWAGPSAEAMMGAVSPYVSWLHATAAQATQMGAQATAAASAYETAHAGVVPPPMIEANRALLQALIATNFFGQNSPAIAATEAHYGEMWAQDGSAMDTYLAAQHGNMAGMQKPAQPPQAAHSLGQDQAGNALPQSMSATPSDGGGSHASSMASSPSPAPTPGGDGGASAGAGGLSDLAQQLSGPASLASVPVRVFATVIFSILIRLLVTLATAGAKGGGAAAGATGLAGAGGGGGVDALMANIGEFVDGKLHSAVGTLTSHFSSATQAISAKLGNAASLGQLKVPEAWSSGPRSPVPRRCCPAPRSAPRRRGSRRWAAATSVRA